jgi:hypothetical protein
LTHASDYTVVITPERILTAADEEGAASTLTDEDETTATQYLDSARLRLTDLFRIKGSMRIWLFVVALMSAAICVIILFLPSLQLGNRDNFGR